MYGKNCCNRLDWTGLDWTGTTDIVKTKLKIFRHTCRNKQRNSRKRRPLSHRAAVKVNHCLFLIPKGSL